MHQEAEVQTVVLFCTVLYCNTVVTEEARWGTAVSVLNYISLVLGMCGCVWVCM